MLTKGSDAGVLLAFMHKLLPVSSSRYCTTSHYRTMLYWHHSIRWDFVQGVGTPVGQRIT
ncbi:MAG: hypothetical protein ACXWMJ_11305 [Syntrophales bacterium]